jgi:hypothetical protein
MYVIGYPPRRKIRFPTTDETGRYSNPQAHGRDDVFEVRLSNSLEGSWRGPALSKNRFLGS